MPVSNKKTDQELLISLSTEIGKLQENKTATDKTLKELVETIKEFKKDINDKHRENLENFKEQIKAINTDIRDQTIKIEGHEANDRRDFNKVNWYIAMGIGILGTLHVVLQIMK